MTGGLFDDPAKPKAAVAKPRRAKPKPMTDRVKAALEAAGHRDAATGAMRTAVRSICPDCGRSVWRGIDSDWCGWARDADPWPLTAVGEAMARLGGWTTVTLRRVGGKFRLDVRDQFIISGEPAGTGRYCDVLTVHRCDVDVGVLPHTLTRLEDSISATELPLLPPF